MKLSYEEMKLKLEEIQYRLTMVGIISFVEHHNTLSIPAADEYGFVFGTANGIWEADFGNESNPSEFTFSSDLDETADNNLIVEFIIKTVKSN